nr:unnamed protein product [Callosobruchus chinensis]
MHYHHHTHRRTLRQTGTVGPVYAAAVAVNVGAMATGTALSWTSNLKPDWRTGDLNDMIISEEVKGWIAQFQSIGGMMACIPTGLLNDYIGRKATLMMATVPFYIGWSCMAFGRYHFFLYMGRFFCGFGSGMFNVTCPLYVGEVSPLAIRGRTLCSFFVFYSFGMLWANFFGYIFPIKLYIFACASLQLMFNSTFFFQPKSPVHSIQVSGIYSRLLLLLPGEAPLRQWSSFAGTSVSMEK